MHQIQRSIRSALRSPLGKPAAALLGLTLACAALSASAAQDGKDAGTRGAVARFDSCAKPQYPHADVQAGHEGTVTLGFLVTPEGKVAQSKVVGSSGFASMDEAARGALVKCRFSPALKNGKPVKEWTEVKYVWTLK